MLPSVSALTAYAEKVYTAFAEAPAAAFLVSTADVKENFAKRLPLKAMLDELEACTAGRLSHEVM